MGAFFKRGEIVVIGRNKKRWCVDVLREQLDGAGEPYVMAELSDERGGKTFAEVSRLTKVGG
jgi:hypothetical protein